MSTESTKEVTNTEHPNGQGQEKKTSGEIKLDIPLKQKVKEEDITIKPRTSGDISAFLSQKPESKLINEGTQKNSGLDTHTPPSNSGQTTNPVTNPSNPEVKRTVATEIEKMDREEKIYSEQFSVEDYEDLAEMMIEVGDTVILAILRGISLDNSDAPYKTPVDKLARMKRILAKILMKAQKKFPLGFMLFAMAVAVYWTPGVKAFNNRKEVMAKRKAIAKEKKELEEKKAKEKSEIKVIHKTPPREVYVPPPVVKTQVEVHPEEQEEIQPPQKKKVRIDPKSQLASMSTSENSGQRKKHVVVPKSTSSLPNIPIRSGKKQGGHNK